MFNNVWKKYDLINYYTLAGIIVSSAAMAHWLDLLAKKPMIVVLGFAIGLALFSVSARIMIIFITAFTSFISLAAYYQMIDLSRLSHIFGTLSTMLVGYALTFSTGRWFVILYFLFLAVIAGIASAFDLVVPV